MKLKNEIDNLIRLLSNVANKENCLLGLSILASINFKTTRQLSKAVKLAKNWVKHPDKIYYPKKVNKDWINTHPHKDWFKYGRAAFSCRHLLCDYRDHDNRSTNRQFKRYYSRHHKEFYEKEGIIPSGNQ